ncbi:MFS transporter [Marinilactibacillus kalidii]|uniref:MFS transporter n=1 Tax=Marinilactibacillus kalidii TaxID=2820274 RepID=UPI001ABEAD22|nr:MFS transporter [Marinilactibacillus kalidii]
MLTILKNKNFSLLMFGNATSILGTLMLNLALSLYVLQLTNSATQFSFVLSLQLLATACLSPFAGTLVDGWNKRKTVIYLDLIRGLFALGMFLLSLHSSLNMAFVYFIVLFYSFSEIFFNPAFASMIPKIVEKEELPNANALYGVIADTSYALAPLIGTSLYALTNISTVLLVTGITYLVSSIVEGFMFFEEENTRGEKVHYLENVMSGFKLLWLDKKITALFTNDVLSHLIIFPFISVGIPYIMLTLLENSEQSYGIIQSIATIGSIASFLLLPVLKK